MFLTPFSPGNGNWKLENRNWKMEAGKWKIETGI
jgi:hypothetical protein